MLAVFYWVIMDLDNIHIEWQTQTSLKLRKTMLWNALTTTILFFFKGAGYSQNEV